MVIELFALSAACGGIGYLIGQARADNWWAKEYKKLLPAATVVTFERAEEEAHAQNYYNQE